MKKLLTIVAAALVLSGCVANQTKSDKAVEEKSISEMFENSEARLLAQTINTDYWNKKAKAMFSIDGYGRTEAYVWLSQCNKGYGHMYFSLNGYSSPSHLLLNGETKTEQIYTQMCNKGVTEYTSWWNGLSKEQQSTYLAEQKRSSEEANKHFMDLVKRNLF